MFDWIELDPSLDNLFLCRQGHIPKDGWQTKDLDCGLWTYRIGADRRIVRMAQKRFDTEFLAVPQDFTNTNIINMYCGCSPCESKGLTGDAVCVEFVLRFDDGHLKYHRRAKLWEEQ